jgi:hypothetical protein
MDLFLAPFADGISGRRGSVVAAFQHGLPVCSTVRKHTDRFLRYFSSPALSLTAGGSKALFAEEAVRMAERLQLCPDLGRELADLHDRHFAWPVIAEQMLMGLAEANLAGKRVKRRVSQSTNCIGG